MHVNAYIAWINFRQSTFLCIIGYILPVEAYSIPILLILFSNLSMWVWKYYYIVLCTHLWLLLIEFCQCEWGTERLNKVWNVLNAVNTYIAWINCRHSTDLCIIGYILPVEAYSIPILLIIFSNLSMWVWKYYIVLCTHLWLLLIEFCQCKWPQSV